MTKDEKAAAKEWKEYYKAIKKYKLDNIQDDAWHQEGHIGYMYDAFFAGFYSGRDYQRDKSSEENILKILDNVKLDKISKEKLALRISDNLL